MKTISKVLFLDTNQFYKWKTNDMTTISFYFIAPALSME